MPEEFEDDQLRKMISGSRIEMPFEDFTKDIMIQILAEKQRRRSVLRNLKLSWLFFGLGMISGILLTVFFSRMDDLILGIETENLIFPVIFCLSLGFILLMEKLVKFSLLGKSR